MGRQAVFLDRDGVLVRSEVRDGKPYAPTRLEDFEILPDSIEATALLDEAGYVLVVVTNQPDVGNGAVEREIVEAMNARLAEVLPLKAIKVCYHGQGEGCACRKPKPGMLIEAAEELGIDLSRSIMVGDRWNDIDAGHAAGCKTVFINRNYGERRPDRPGAVSGSLMEAAQIIVGDGLN